MQSNLSFYRVFVLSILVGLSAALPAQEERRLRSLRRKCAESTNLRLLFLLPVISSDCRESRNLHFFLRFCFCSSAARRPAPARIVQARPGPASRVSRPANTPIVLSGHSMNARSAPLTPARRADHSACDASTRAPERSEGSASWNDPLARQTPRS